jgi:DNA-binding transcriptional ArsR family regulator
MASDATADDSRSTGGDTGPTGARGLAAMRALAHPTRVSIVRLLEQHPALTATECGNSLGLSAKTCSYHLQTLAAAGVVAELPGAGRNRPWQLVGTTAAAAVPAADPLRRVREQKLAARARREHGVLGHAVDAVTRATVDPAWSEASTVYDRVAHMSPDELHAWGEDVERLTRRHLRRSAQSGELGDGVVRHPVHLLFYGFPEAAAEPSESIGSAG